MTVSSYGAQIVKQDITSLQATRKLAKLMARELDVHIDATALRLFIRMYWNKVSIYAHLIGDEKPAEE